MDNKETIKVLKRMLTPDLEADEFYAIKRSIKSLEMWKAFEMEIAKMKREQNSENYDYRIGFICALSIVEGLLAKGERNVGL